MGEEQPDGPGQKDAVAPVRSLQGEEEFANVLQRYRRELHLHCYRMLGSLQDAEDLVQETSVRAWRGRDTLHDLATVRPWLYRIATNACLDFLRRTRRRPVAHTVEAAGPGSLIEHPPAEVRWLQPYPDRLLDEVAAGDPGPDSRLVAKETIELAFLVAIQHLPVTQRAVLILRDVLGWPADDVASLLDLSIAAVKSALQRARATLRNHLLPQRTEWASPGVMADQERMLLRRYVAAHEQSDAAVLADLLSEEVRLTMPPHPLWFVGRDPVVALHAEVFDPASSWYHGEWRTVPTRANRQLAAAHYVKRPGHSRFTAQVVDVLRMEEGRIVEITAFEPHLFAAFGLPETL